MMKTEAAMEAEISGWRPIPLSGGDPAQRVDGSPADAESQSVSVARLVRSQQEVRGTEAEQGKEVATMERVTTDYAEQIATSRYQSKARKVSDVGDEPFLAELARCRTEAAESTAAAHCTKNNETKGSRAGAIGTETWGTVFRLMRRLCSVR